MYLRLTESSASRKSVNPWQNETWARVNFYRGKQKLHEQKLQKKTTEARTKERKIPMNCDIIKDLLPVYIDGLTSEASNAEIKNHLAGCADCTAYYENMQREIEDAAPAATEKEIDFLKKIKERT